MRKERTHLFVICDYGCPRLDGLDGSGGLNWSGILSHVKREDSPLFSGTMAAQDLMAWMGLWQPGSR
jgi:hypothetical protein